MKKMIYITLGLLIHVSMFAQIDRSKQPTPGPAPQINIKKAKTFKLENGLQVFVVENHKLPSAFIYLKMDNPPVAEGTKKGVSNLVGSVMGNGTTTTTKEDFNNQVDFLGANISFSDDGASANTLSRYFKEVMKLTAEGALHPLFTEKEFEDQKARLLDNLKTNEKNTPQIVGRVYSALLYGKQHPFGEFLQPDVIKNITLADVESYYNSNYVPNNAYLVVVGDVKFEEVKKLASLYFSTWKKTDHLTVPTYADPVKLKTPEIDLVDVPNAVQTEIRVGNTVHLKLSDPDYFASILAAQVLGGGGEARLFLNLRESHGWTYGAYSNIDVSKYITNFTAYAAVRSTAVDSSVVEILKEIKRIQSTPVNEDELKLAKAKYIGGFVMNVEKSATIAQYTLNEKTENLPENFYENYIKNLNAVTLEQVQAAANKYFEGTRIVIAGNAANCLEGLEKLNIPMVYYDKYANPTNKPSVMTVPVGVTPTSVLTKYIDAIGGKKLLLTVKTLSSVATGTMQGQTISIYNAQTTDGKQIQETKAMGNVVSKLVFNGTSGYLLVQGKKEALDADALADAKGNPFPELALLTATDAKIIGVEAIDGHQAYKLASGNKIYFYDAQSGLKIAEETSMKTHTQRLSFDDYRAEKGILMPHKMSIEMGKEIPFIISDIKINNGVSASDFN